MPNAPDDFTFFRDYEVLDDACRNDGDPPPPNADKGDPFSRDVVVNLKLASKGRKQTADFTGRALVCGCFGGKYLSVTCRRLADADNAGKPLDWTDLPVEVPPRPRGRRFTPPKRTRPFEEWNERLIDELWGSLQSGHRTRRTLTGLIVVSGRTGSGKSEIARALVNRCMAVHEAGDRLPHLVTYEDPIEKPFAASPEEARSRGFDYTPRQKGVDAGTLRKALMDALRQTPAVFYVGETRDEKDWKELLRFAGTGHLAITTAHAGSLVETMEQIVQADRVKTPAERSHVASRLVALLHIRAFHIKGPKRRKVLVPAFWWRTPRSVSAFTAEGLGSILSNHPEARAPAAGCHGRAHFVNRLDFLSEVPGLRQKAIEWDLRSE